MEIAKNQPRTNPEKDHFAMSIPHQHVQMLSTKTLRLQRGILGRHVITAEVSFWHVHMCSCVFFYLLCLLTNCQIVFELDGNDNNQAGDCKTTYEEKAICFLNETMEECSVIVEKESDGTIEYVRETCNNFKGDTIY